MNEKKKVTKYCKYTTDVRTYGGFCSFSFNQGGFLRDY